MTPENLATLLDRHGSVLDTWPLPERQAAAALLATSEAARGVFRRAERLDTLLRSGFDEGPDAARVDRVIALTLAAAGRTPQHAPMPGWHLRAWWNGHMVRLLTPNAGLLRFAVPVAVALVLGVLVGHASVDQAAYSAVPTGVETLLTVSHSTELFGL